MDTGNAVGDVFFDLMMAMMAPIACNPVNGSMSPWICINPEAVDPDLVVNKLTLEVDAQYSNCVLLPGVARHHIMLTHSS